MLREPRISRYLGPQLIANIPDKLRRRRE